MKIGIRLGDNDFSTDVARFMKLFIIPEFIESDGHPITHLTSTQIVELFNKYMTPLAILGDFEQWSPEYRKDYGHYSEYLRINETNIFWDDLVDNYINSGETDSDFTWTDGREVTTT